jgi:hypothetical protein
MGVEAVEPDLARLDALDATFAEEVPDPCSPRIA